MTYSLRPDLADAVKASLAEWQASGKMHKLWTRDASLWTGDDEGKWLDWLTIVHDQLSSIQTLTSLAAEVKARNFDHILLLGM
jgi:transaldolase / glucose-6-phosphate isomerase